ncbi:MAG: ABC transporter substrate-binding protein [Anaerosomatales bacterium]|nr:ABC transporter substrate-binding protein [Anaerosomatales bacterium]MDT8433328.1 ABC transporter substrate-binding protein [Anaerosomatales bacterium]
MTTTRWHFASVVTLVAAMAVVSLSACGAEDGPGDDGAAPAEPYRIGAVLSLSGTYAGLGEPEKNTIEMEVERINEAGGVNGRPIEVIIVDDATDAETAVAVTTRLIEQDEVIALIGATGTGATMAMRQEVDRAGIPQVSIAGGTVITADFHPLVFQTAWSNSLVVPFTLRYLEGKGVSKVAIIADSGGFGADGAAVIKDVIGTTSLELVAEEAFNPGDADMTGQLTKIKSSGAEAVLMWNAGREAATVAKNMAALDIGIPLIGSHGNARVEFIDGAGDAAEDFVFAAGKVLVPEAYAPGSDEQVVATDFIERYTERYGVAPDTFAGHAYDGLYLVVEAMKRLPEEFTAEELRDEIESTNGFVGIGGVFTFSPTDHNGLSDDDLVMYRVSGGVWTLEK